jgi:hypothetical protein
MIPAGFGLGATPYRLNDSKVSHGRSSFSLRKTRGDASRAQPNS